MKLQSAIQGILLGLGAAVSTIPNAHAYAVSTHKKITARAVEEYRLCAQRLKSLGTATLPELPANASGVLQSANAYEDLNLFLKATNWHFYRPGADLGSGSLWLGHGSMESRFHSIEADLRESPRLDRIGQLSHYIQDVTNPAHVIPVFHSAFDSFDNYDFDQVMPTAEPSDSDCDELAHSAMLVATPFEIMDHYARETLTRSESSLSYTEGGEPHSVKWSVAYWDPSYGSGSIQEGFGRYGSFGNNFGETDFRGKHVDALVYAEFARAQIRSALDGTLLLLMKFQQELGPF